jgi:hypothetical protein
MLAVLVVCFAILRRGAVAHDISKLPYMNPKLAPETCAAES